MLDRHYHGKRVFITGHTGFKGAWLTEWLLMLGARVHGYALQPPTDPSLFEQLDLAGRMEHQIADIRDADELAKAVREFRPHFVFHLAAQSLVRLSYERPLETYAVNVMGTANLLDALRPADWPCAVVVVTSDKCYENKEWVYGYRETDPMGGHDPYSSSKGAAELVVASYRNSFFKSHPVKIASARAGNVIGGGDWARDRIVPDCIRALQRGEAIPVRNKVSTRPWQHVLEPLSGYLWLGARLAAGDVSLHGDSFNFGPRAEVDETVIRLIDALRRHWPEAVAPEVHASPPGLHEAGLLRLDCTKAEKNLAWRATLEFDETARFTAAWFRAYAADPAAARRTTQAQIEEYVSLAQQRGLAWANPAKEKTGR